MTISTLLLGVCVVLGVLSWCLAALLFVQARRDYRGPSGLVSWLSPFALWAPAHYTGMGATRIRRSLACFVVFIACTVTALVVAQMSNGGRLW